MFNLLVLSIEGHLVEWLSELKVYPSQNIVFKKDYQYFTYIDPIVNKKRAKTGVPGEKPPDLAVKNFASHMYLEQGLNNSGERSMFKNQRS